MGQLCFYFITGNRCGTLKHFSILFSRQIEAFISRRRSAFGLQQMGAFNNAVISWETTRTVAEYFSSERLGKWISWKILFWAAERQGKFRTAWQFTLFWAFYKILCHLWLQWAACISYTCATRDILPEFSLCTVATLAFGDCGGVPPRCASPTQELHVFPMRIKGIVAILFTLGSDKGKMYCVPFWKHAA